MKKAKNPPCSGFEFSLRRAAAGLNYQTIKEIAEAKITPLQKVSISALTKWNAGQMPVSWKAYQCLQKVEQEIENEVLRIVDEIEHKDALGVHLLIITTPSNAWRYGTSTHAVAAARAKVITSLTYGERVRIDNKGKSEKDTPPYLYKVPDFELVNS